MVQKPYNRDILALNIWAKTPVNVASAGLKAEKFKLCNQTQIWESTPTPSAAQGTSLISIQNLHTTMTPSGCHTKNWNNTEKLFSLCHLNFSHDFGFVFHFLCAWCQLYMHVGMP
jgi:hypothetical protein